MTRIFLVACFIIVWNIGAAGLLVAQDLLVTNARIIVGNGTVVERGSILVRGGRIVSVSEAVPNAPGVQTIEAGGMTAMAGFIDAHRHIMRGNDQTWFAEQSRDRMQEFLETGYTTLMSGGGPVPGIVELQERIESGRLIGPRIITSGRADTNVGEPEQARAHVRMLADSGVEIIKARLDDDRFVQQSEILLAITDEAQKHGIDVMVHATSPATMVAAVRAGAAKLVHTPHAGWLTEEDAEVVQEAGVEALSTIGYGVPVFGVFNQDNTPTFRDGSPWPEGIGNGFGRGREAGEKAVNGRTLWDAGVTYGFGTDTGYHPKAGLAHELRALNLVFSPVDLIKLMGPNTAAFIGRSDDLGTLEPGKMADIVILEGNPLEGYWNLLNAQAVIKGGVVVVDHR